MVYQSVTFHFYGTVNPFTAAHPHTSSFHAFTIGLEGFTEGGLVTIIVCRTVFFL